MICPKCGHFYGREFKVCSDCNLKLTVASYEINRNNKFHVINLILGIVGGPLHLIIALISIAHNSLLPPELSEEHPTSSHLPNILLIYWGLVLIINIVGIVVFIRTNKDISYGLSLLRFILINFFIFVPTFIISLLALIAYL